MKRKSRNIVGVEKSMEEINDRQGKGSSVSKGGETLRLEIKRYKGFLGNLPEPASSSGYLRRTVLS